MFLRRGRSTAESTTPELTLGLTDADLVPYIVADISRLLGEFKQIFSVLFSMMDALGLETSAPNQFWRGISAGLQNVLPDTQYEVRAKRTSEDLISQGLAFGLRIWLNAKFWIEQVRLPTFHTHVDFPDEPNRLGKFCGGSERSQSIPVALEAMRERGHNNGFN
jgi:hypothetical protein